MSASGKIQPKRVVNISADTMGRVTDLAVNEGDRVTKGQFLLQIDPRNLRTAVQRTEASFAAANRRSISCAWRSRASQGRAEAGAGQLQAPAEPLEGRADDARDARARGERTASCAKRTSGRRSSSCGRSSCAWSPRARQRAERPLRSQQGAHRVADHRHRHAPQHRRRGNGRHRDDEQRRHGAADDRRHVGHRGRGGSRRNRHPDVRLGQTAKVTIDAMPGQTFTGQGHRDRQQPDPGGRRQRRRAGDELQGRRHARQGDPRRAARASRARPRSRPRCATTCSSVPIQATTVREMVVDDKGNVVRPPADGEAAPPAAAPGRSRPRS